MQTYTTSASRPIGLPLLNKVHGKRDQPDTLAAERSADVALKEVI